MSTTYQYKDGVKSTSTLNLISYTVTSDDATANTVSFATPSGAIAGGLVDILRSDVSVKADADISWSGNTLTVADGAATYALTAGDIIVAVAFGSAE